MEVEERNAEFIDDTPPVKNGCVRFAFRGLMNLLLVFLSIALTLAAFEFGTRYYHGDFRFRNKLIANLDLFRSDYPVDYDPTLGWVPKAGTRRGHRITVLEHGVRSNGQHRRKYPIEDAILAVGDSFTWGYGIGDTETWPAQLEAQLRTKVLNAGIFGFGVGQTYLRLEQLLEVYKPKTFIFSFIPDDINRAELSHRSSVPKPYFSINDGELVLNNDHVVKPVIRKSIGTARYVLGFSLLAHKLMSKAFPEIWYAGGWRKTRAHDQGPQVACLLFEKLGRLVEEGKVKQGLLLVQYSRYPSRENYHRVDHALECARNGPMEIIDLRADLEEMLHGDKTDFYSMYLNNRRSAHMNKKGNDFVAHKLANFLQKPN